MRPSQSSASTCPKRALRCRSAPRSPYLARTDTRRRRHGLRWKPHRNLRVQHRSSRSRSRCVRSRPDLGAQLLGSDAAARYRVGRLRELHGGSRRGPRARLLRRGQVRRLARIKAEYDPGTSSTSTPISNRRCSPSDLRSRGRRPNSDRRTCVCWPQHMTTGLRRSQVSSASWASMNAATSARAPAPCREWSRRQRRARPHAPAHP